jgi:3-oxoadipate enol-lactonase
VKASEGFADVDGGRLYYETAGRGPAVVLVHGGLWDRRMWDDQLEALAAEHFVIRYDLRNYGRSDRATAPFSHVRDLRALLVGLGIDRAALVALSMGGAVTIDFALEHPDMVRALVLASSGASGYGEWSEDMRRAWKEVEEAVEAGDLERAADLELRIWTPLRTDPGVDAKIRRMYMDNLQQLTLDEDLIEGPGRPAVDRLEQIAVPTLVLVGDRDVPEMQAIADLLADRIPGARKVVMEGVDHAPNMRKPAEFNQHVLAFLRGLGPA